MLSEKYIQKIKPEDLKKIIPFLQVKPVNLIDIANVFGISVYSSDLPDDESGLIQPSNNGYEIIVNKNEFQEWTRFTIAHELAHYLLHRDKLSVKHIDHKPVLRRSATNMRDYEEREADELAAEILMPKYLFEEEVKKARKRR